MIVAVRGRNREVRAVSEFGSSAIPTPAIGGGGDLGIGASGLPVSTNIVAGIPAVANAVTLLAETIGSLPLEVLQAVDVEERRRAPETWQWQFLHDGPVCGDVSDLNVWEDVATSIEYDGNAYLEKVRFKGQVVELCPLSPSSVMPRRDKASGAKMFDVVLRDGHRKTVGTDVILHIRGRTLGSGLKGASTVQLHRDAFSTMVAQEVAGAAVYRNGGAPSGYIAVPGNLNVAQARQMLRVWRSSHGGVRNLGKPGILYNGAEWKQVGLSLTDQQFIEAKGFSVADVARIFRVPLGMLADPSMKPGATAEQDTIRFVAYALAPRCARIEHALRADPDLFGATNLWPHFNFNRLLRGDMKTRFAAWLQARQGGWLSGNDIRTEEGWPRVPGLDDVQQTPVGGAPNLQPGTPPEEPPAPEEGAA